MFRLKRITRSSALIAMLAWSPSTCAESALPCGSVRLRVVAEEVPEHFTLAVIERDLKSPWAAILSEIELIDAGIAKPQTVLQLKGRVADKGRVLVTLQDGFEFSAPTGPIGACELADLLVKTDRLKERFLNVRRTCASSTLAFLGLGEIAAVPRIEFSVANKMEITIVKLNERSATERCALIGRQIREDGEVAVVVLSAETIDGYEGHAWGDDKTMRPDGSANIICLPEHGYKPWLAAHEFGHVVLDSSIHPCDQRRECSGNVMNLSIGGNLTTQQLELIWANSVSAVPALIQGCGMVDFGPTSSEDCLSGC